jgi:anaerobic selenocysteine-containing dehydrogenase
MLRWTSLRLLTGRGMTYRNPMNIATPLRAKSRIGHSACPHDCPCACALEVDLGEDGRIARVRGAGDHSYTAGVGTVVPTGADPIAPHGGAAVHDNKIWLRKDAA